MPGLDAIAPIDTAALPAEVRAAPPRDQELYQSALAFERLLVGQLAKAMTATAGLGGADEGDGEDGGDAGGGAYAQMLPDALADGAAAAGGLGLAADLWRSMRGAGS